MEEVPAYRSFSLPANAQHSTSVSDELCVETPARIQVSRILLDWIHRLLMAVASNVVVLSSIKIGAPASSEGT